MSETIKRLGMLLAAGHQHPPARLPPDLIPADYAQAMAVQAIVGDTFNRQISGWKVALRPDGIAVAAPLFTSLVTRKPHFAVPAVGLMGIEVEIGLLLKHDVPARQLHPYSRDEILAATQSLFIGLEVVSTRLPDHANAPFPLVLADNMANGGYVIGDEILSWDGLDLRGLHLSVIIDGKEVHSKPGGHGNGDPLVPVVAYASAQIDHFGGLRAGQFITTGTLCGLIPVATETVIEGRIEAIGAVRLKLAARN